MRTARKRSREKAKNATQIVRRVRMLTRQQGLTTLAKLAERTDYSVSQIARVLKGDQPITTRMLYELAGALDVSPEYLEHGVEPDPEAAGSVETYLVGAGHYVAIDDEPPPDYTPWPDPKALCALRVMGDSMEPIARDGQLVLAEKAVWPRSGDLAYVELEDGDALFRRVHVLDGGTRKERWLLQPINPAYDAQEVPRRQIRRAMKVWGVKF